MQPEDLFIGCHLSASKGWEALGKCASASYSVEARYSSSMDTPKTIEDARCAPPPCYTAVTIMKGMAAMASSAPRSVREYRLGEEIANAITHGIGALLAIAVRV